MGITVEKRKLAGGRVALYLNFSFGHKRWRESLHLTLEDPAAHVRLVQQNEFTKAVLTQDEIRRLATVPCLHAEVKRAFLFACMTGLRWCDVVALRTESVDEAGCSSGGCAVRASTSTSPSTVPATRS